MTYNENDNDFIIPKNCIRSWSRASYILSCEEHFSFSELVSQVLTIKM